MNELSSKLNFSKVMIARVIHLKSSLTSIYMSTEILIKRLRTKYVYYEFSRLATRLSFFGAGAIIY